MKNETSNDNGQKDDNNKRLVIEHVPPEMPEGLNNKITAHLSWDTILKFFNKSSTSNLITPDISSRRNAAAEAAQTRIRRNRQDNRGKSQKIKEDLKKIALEANVESKGTIRKGENQAEYKINTEGVSISAPNEQYTRLLVSPLKKTANSLFSSSESKENFKEGGTKEKENKEDQTNKEQSTKEEGKEKNFKEERSREERYKKEDFKE